MILFLFIFALLKKEFFIFNVNIKMSYYWFNKQEILQKAKEKYDNGGKEKAAEYYQANRDVIKQKANERYRNLSGEEKEAKKSTARIDIKQRKKNQIYFYSIKMSEQTLKFNDIVVNKKVFLASKQAIALN